MMWIYLGDQCQVHGDSRWRGEVPVGKERLKGECWSLVMSECLGDIPFPGLEVDDWRVRP